MRRIRRQHRRTAAQPMLVRASEQASRLDPRNVSLHRDRFHPSVPTHLHYNTIRVRDRKREFHSRMFDFHLVALLCPRHNQGSRLFVSFPSACFLQIPWRETNTQVLKPLRSRSQVASFRSKNREGQSRITLRIYPSCSACNDSLPCVHLRAEHDG